MSMVNEIAKQIILDDIKDLPVRLTVKDIYNHFNKDKHIIGKDRVYDIAREIGHRFREGGKIYINKTDFIRYVYKDDLAQN